MKDVRSLSPRFVCRENNNERNISASGAGEETEEEGAEDTPRGGKDGFIKSKSFNCSFMCCCCCSSNQEHQLHLLHFWQTTINKANHYSFKA